MGSGVSWQQAYNHLFPLNRTIVGGISPNGTVGAAGGWITGGGHSILSPTYGLGVDNVLQFRIVLSTGRIVDVNECSETDLWWALRGGGGGTFGVITQVWYKTYQDGPGLAAYFVAGAADGTAYVNLLNTFLKEQPILADNRWGGYHMLYSDSSNHSLGVSLYRPNISNANTPQLNQSISAFFAAMANTTGVTVQTSIVMPSITFKQIYAVLQDPSLISSSSPTLAQRHIQGRKRALNDRQIPASPDTDALASSFQTSRIIPRSVYSGTNLTAYATFISQQTAVIGQ